MRTFWVVNVINCVFFQLMVGSKHADNYILHIDTPVNCWMDWVCVALCPASEVGSGSVSCIWKSCPSILRKPTVKGRSSSTSRPNHHAFTMAHLVVTCPDIPNFIGGI